MQARKPTYNQRKTIEKNGLDPQEWYVEKDTADMMQVRNTRTEERKTLQKR